MASKERPSVASEPYFDIPCAVCSKAGKNVEATKTCLDCKQTLCDKCINDHDKFDITKGHRVLDKATTVAGQIPSKMCGEHGGKLVDMYCSQHDRVYCTSCIAIHHRRCDGIDYVPAISAGTKTSKELNSALRDMKDELAKLQKTKKKREDDKTRLASEKGRSERNVQESAIRIIKCINELKDESLHQIKQQYDTFQKKVDDDIKNINDTIAALENDIKCMQPPSSENDSELFVTLKLSKDNKGRGASLNSEMGIRLTREAVHFNADYLIEKNMKKAKSLGELETPFFASMLLGRYKMRVKQDTQECCIINVCSMPYGTTLATDFNNTNLKRLDSSYNVIDQCKLPGHPHSICRTGPTEVAITLGTSQTIQFVSVATTMTPTRSFRVGKTCRGIAYNRGQLFVTCGGNRMFMEGPGEVRVYTTYGKLLHNLPQNPANQQIWTCPLRVAASPDGSEVIVPNMGRGLVTMDRDGSNVNENPQVLVDDLCVQDQSLWFNCNGQDKRIYQLNVDWSRLGALLTEENGIDEIPTAVCYQRDSNRLIVGFESSDYIKVFQLHRK